MEIDSDIEVEKVETVITDNASFAVGVPLLNQTEHSNTMTMSNDGSTVVPVVYEEVEEEKTDKLWFIKLNKGVTKCNMITLFWSQFLFIVIAILYSVLTPQIMVERFNKTEAEAG